MEIEYKGNQPGRGKIAHNRYHVSVYLRRGSTINSHALRQKLVRDGVKAAPCERCGLETWLEQPIPLELHHMDGDRTNNELTNLELLCPNCHAMCDNNSGRATSNDKAQVAQRQRQCA